MLASTRFIRVEAPTFGRPIQETATPLFAGQVDEASGERD